MAGDTCAMFKSGPKKRKCFRQHTSSDDSESEGEDDVSRKLLQDTKENPKASQTTLRCESHRPQLGQKAHSRGGSCD
ncbi:hypothetical protein MRX96_027762 [Rhipicephalus microplus]